jgi:hypothetical protein
MKNKIFPQMLSTPEKITIFSLIPCWLWIFVLFPMFMPFVGLGIWEETELGAWLDIFYHVSNGILVLFIIGSYLKDEWFMVKTDVRHYLKHVGVTVGIIFVADFLLLACMNFLGFDIAYIMESLPVTEMPLSQSSILLVSTKPIFGTIALSLFSPIAICGLFYCLGFAPICNNKPWLAYLCIAGITMIPPIINILWRGDIVFSLCGYIICLPIHLMACWSYQKTDNVWTPLISLVITNLLTSVGAIIILFV